VENRRLVEFVAAICALLFLTAAGLFLRSGFFPMTLLYLFAVLALALRLGIQEVVAIFVAAVVCDAMFFGLPGWRFFTEDPRNAAMLGLFLAIALMVSRQASRARHMAHESRLRRYKLQRLFAVSRGALLLDLNDSPERQMAELILREFQLKAVAIVHESGGTSGAAGLWQHLGDDLEIHRLLGMEQVPMPEHSAGALSTELRSGQGPIGTLLVLGEIDPLAFESLGSLVALMLERHTAFIREGSAEAARQTEQLRSTVLDGLAHAFKTPLTIIRAASSGLLEVGGMDELQTGLTRMIDEQSARLDELATRLLQTARVGDEDLCLQLERVDIGELLHEVVERFQRESAAWADDSKAVSQIDVQVPDYPLRISADHEMLRSTLTELLDNAVKYSEVGSPVRVSAQGGEGELLLSVHSWGEVIQLEDRERIFERFYRSREQRHSVPGTGIGLSVARRATEAHRGHIWVTSSEAEGTTFHVSLPRELTHS
jgi:two-component system sensor histidine kinase KdpD